RKHLPAAARFAAVGFVAVLLPVSNIVPIMRFADRYVLIALAILTPPLAMLADRARWRNCRFLLPVIVILAGVEGWRSEQQVRVWHDSLTLWEHAVRAQPNVLLAHIKRGETLRDAGLFPEAISEYQ